LKTVFCDIETNGLENPDKIWCIVCKDADTGEISEFLNVHSGSRELFLSYASSVTCWIGHNWLGFDSPNLSRIIGQGDFSCCIDTLVVSQLINFPRPEGHSLESYGDEAKIAKIGTDITDWSVFDGRMVDRCRSDVAITEYVYYKYLKYIQSPLWADALRVEHALVPLCNELKTNGFFFNRPAAIALKSKIDLEVFDLEDKLTKVFPPRTVLVREITPKATKHGTINRSDFRWNTSGDLSSYTVGYPFSLLSWESFNPGSTKQRIDRLWDANWNPTERTKGYKAFLQSLPREKDPKKKSYFARYGWKTSEENLKTLPADAPPAIQTLVQWLLLKPRSRRIEEWLGCCGEDSRIHGTFHGIGAWSGRMSHSNPNMGNVPKFDSKQPEKTPYSDNMRALWSCPGDKFLVGVDAESIQLRVLAHYLEDREFTDAIVSGDKSKGTDPHSVNQRALGSVCKSREDAKTFIYAWLLGAGVGKVADILHCSKQDAEEARANFLKRYERLGWLKDRQIPTDARNGWFRGFDGRCVTIPGDSQGEREHLALAGYLQSGETIVMKRALVLWHEKLTCEKVPFKFVNFVHDEYQTEVPRDMEIAKYVAQTQADAIRQVGIDLHLKCPMSGSILAGNGGLAIGDNWMETH
jgi:DNA polymerase-1